MASILLTSFPVNAAETHDRKAASYDTVFHDDRICALSVSSSDAEAGTGKLMGVTMPNTDPEALSTNIKKWIAKHQPDSPLKNMNDLFVSLGSEHNVNPALAVGMSVIETSVATAGFGRPDSQKNVFNVGNRSEGSYGYSYNTPGARFQTYPNYEASFKVYYTLLEENYIGPPTNFKTVAQIVNKYAPPVENDVTRYVDVVKRVMRQITEGLSEGVATVNAAPSFIQKAHAAPGDPGDGGSDTLEGHKLPAIKGGTGREEAIDSSGRVSSGKTIAFSKHAALGKNYQDYYIAMRWRYSKWGWDGSTTKGPEDDSWFNEKPRKLLVTNPKTKKSIIAVAAEAGPAPWTGTPFSAANPPSYWQSARSDTPPQYKGRVSGLAPVAFEAIGASQRMSDGSGVALNYAWAPDQNAEPGPTDQIIAPTEPQGDNCSKEGNGLNGSNASIVDIARQELAKNVREKTRLCNCGDRIDVYTNNHPEPWCADFVSWVYKEAGRPFQKTPGLTAADGWRIPGAWNIGIYFKDKKNEPGIAYGSPAGGDKPQPGYIITFNGGQGHVGIIVEVKGSTIVTIEGNTSSTKFDANGGAVASHSYKINEPRIREWGGYKE